MENLAEKFNPILKLIHLPDDIYRTYDKMFDCDYWDDLRDSTWESARRRVNPTEDGKFWERLGFTDDKSYHRCRSTPVTMALLAVTDNEHAYELLSADVKEIEVLARLGNESAILMLPLCVALNKNKDIN